MDGHKSRVFSACFRPKSAHELISGGWDNTIQFWDSRQPYALKRISGVHMCGDGLDISKNGKEVFELSFYSRISTRLPFGTIFFFPFLFFFPISRRSIWRNIFLPTVDYCTSKRWVSLIRSINWKLISFVINRFLPTFFFIFAVSIFHLW